MPFLGDINIQSFQTHGGSSRYGNCLYTEPDGLSDSVMRRYLATENREQCNVILSIRKG